MRSCVLRRYRSDALIRMLPSSTLSLRMLRGFRRTGGVLGVWLALIIAAGALLGMLHAIAHPPEAPLEQITPISSGIGVGAGLAPPAWASGVPAGTADPALARSWLERLFDHKAGDRDCRIFDKLCHGPAAPAAAMLSLSFAAPVAALLLAQQGDFVARWTTLFDARGPPRVS
jgi:hypothetical protein